MEPFRGKGTQRRGRNRLFGIAKRASALARGVLKGSPGQPRRAGPEAFSAGRGELGMDQSFDDTEVVLGGFRTALIIGLGILLVMSGAGF